MNLFPERSGAEFSPCRTWRYCLWRLWNDELPSVMFVGLNPSTADETQDDPTIRRCIGFARDWGYGGLYMLNLFAFRATDPREMMKAEDPVGPRNDETLATYHRTLAALTVAAWGRYGNIRGREGFVMKSILTGGVKCLGLNQDGSPKHPLYLPKAAALVDFG